MDNNMNGGMLNGGNFAEFLILLLLIGAGNGGGLFGGNRDNNVSNEFQMTQGKLDGITASTNAGFANTQMGFAAMAQQLSKCCCDIQLQASQLNNETNRHMDNVLFSLTSSGTANTQSVINRVDALQDSLKDQRIRDLETQLGACNTRDTVGAMVAPINATLATILAQLNCGVKAIAHTPSLPAFAPAAYTPYPVYNQFPFGGYGHGHGCHNDC